MLCRRQLCRAALALPLQGLSHTQLSWPGWQLPCLNPSVAGALQVEVAAARSAFGQCGGKLRQVALVDSHSPEGQRTAVVVAKVGHTQKRYPRVAGTPNKRPL
jgi:hypothetical protein